MIPIGSKSILCLQLRNILLMKVINKSVYGVRELVVLVEELEGVEEQDRVGPRCHAS